MLKRRICHFIKWQIRCFDIKVVFKSTEKLELVFTLCTSGYNKEKRHPLIVIQLRIHYYAGGVF